MRVGGFLVERRPPAWCPEAVSGGNGRDMPKKSFNNEKVKGPFNQRNMLMILVAWLISFMCAAATVLPVWVQITPTEDVSFRLLAAIISALATGIVSFLGALAVLHRLMR